jgi:hypothetical protein
MKKILLVIVCLCCISLYCSEYKNFFGDNDIILSIKKIPVGDTKEILPQEKDFLVSSYDLYTKNIYKYHRYPFNEYHISDKFTLLKIEYTKNKLENGEIIGYFSKKYLIFNLDDKIKNELSENLKELQDLNLETEKLKIYAEDFDLFISFRETVMRKYMNIEEEYKHLYSLFKINDKKIVKLNSLYEIEIKKDNKELAFLIGSDPNAYIGNEKIQNLIRIVNKIIFDVDETNRK